MSVAERTPIFYTHSRRDGKYERGDVKGWTEPLVGYRRPDVPWNGLTATDLFCGAGGSSSGLVEAGFKVVIAANHWKRAIESHQMNHPETDHSQADISQVDPRYFPRTHLLWGSPECTNHTIAKGIKRQRKQDLALFELDGTRPLPDEAANRSRATMWDIPRFAEHHRYMAIVLENVVEAYRWDQFPAWQQAMESLGYRMQFVWLNSMHAQIGGLPAPQSRDRMYIVMWREDLATKERPGPNMGKWTRPMAVCPEHGEVQAAQAFKKAEQWGRYRTQYVYVCPECWQPIEPGWLGAESIIDWSIPTPRIGDRPLKEFWADKKKTVSLGFHHLAPKTLDRGRRGIEKYWTPLVVEAAGNAYDSTDPRHPAFGREDGYIRAWPAEEPLRTLHGSASKGLMIPPLIVNNVSGADAARSRPATEPLPSLVAGGTHAALLVPVEGREGKNASPAHLPLRTQSTRNETGVLVPLVVPMRNHGVAKPITEPIDTVSAEGNHHALIMRNNRGGAEMSTPVTEPLRTLTTTGHQSLVTPSDPISLDILEAGFRMLEPHEIQAGMGFARDYLLLGSKREKVKQAGNAVTPPAARDLGHAVAEFLLAVAS